MPLWSGEEWSELMYSFVDFLQRWWSCKSLNCFCLQFAVNWPLQKVNSRFRMPKFSSQWITISDLSASDVKPASILSGTLILPPPSQMHSSCIRNQSFCSCLTVFRVLVISYVAKHFSILHNLHCRSATATLHALFTDLTAGWWRIAEWYPAQN